MPQKRKVSERLIANLKEGLTHSKKAETPFYCWRIDELKMQYTDEQRRRLSEAQDLHHKAQDIVKDVYAEIIGKQIVKECAK